jgi:hypothetical protein
MLEWFERLLPEARVQCISRIELLRLRGHELRRPHADHLRDGIYELRSKSRGVNLRMLYFFHGQDTVVLSHGVTKQRAAVLPMEIERARRRKQLFEANPPRRTYREP